MINSQISRQNGIEKNFESFRALYKELLQQKSEIINTLMSQNFLIERQLSNKNIYGVKNELSVLQKQKGDDFYSQSYHENEEIKLDHNEEVKLSQSMISTEKEKQVIVQRSSPHYRELDNLLQRKIKEKSQQLRYKNQPQTAIQLPKYQRPIQRKVSTYRRPPTGYLQDVPGNPLENRLISEFFQKQFPVLISITGEKQCTIYKKELLACYIRWRLKQIPNQTRLKLVNIQVNISAYIRGQLKEKCEILRHVYTGMKFKSLKTIKEIKNINLDNYKIYEKRGRTKYEHLKQIEEPYQMQTRRTAYNQNNRSMI